MSDREKNLIRIVGVLLFVILNLGVFKLWYLPQKQAAEAREKEFVELKMKALAALGNQDSKRDEIDWLQRSEQKLIKSSQKALADLEAMANREAKRRGLTVKRVRPMPAIEDQEFSRARVEIEVSGREQVLFQWIDRLNSPSELRTATSMRINPKKDDDTQVDCAIILEQWFVPEGAAQDESAI